MNDFSTHLQEALASIDFEITSEQMAKCNTYCKLLLETNEKMNLTAITDLKEVAVKHFADSLYLLKAVEIPMGATLIDIGTGAGFPGLPLKIFRQDLHIMLLDSLEKRCKFLTEVLAELGLGDIEVLWSRAEDAARNPLLREHFDYATARAVATLPVLLEYSLPLLKVGGEFLPLKGKEEDVPMANALELLGGELVAISNYELPLIAEERSIYRFRKLSPTLDKYPRPAGKVSKKPL